MHESERREGGRDGGREREGVREWKIQKRQECNKSQ